MSDTPPRIDAEKVAALYGTQVAGNLNLALGEGRSERIAVHKPPRNLPERQKKFAGREAELIELHEALSAGADVGITQQTAVHGHGGVGKTSIATEYGWRHLADYPGGVFFLSCEGVPGAPRLEELAPHLGLPAADTAEETAQRVRAHLATGEPSLLILDNVRGPDQCLADDWSRNLPAGTCRRLITTRADWLPDVPMYRLQRLSREDGVKLLAQYRADVLRDGALASRIVEWFDGLAVGLTVVGVYMQMHQRLAWRHYVDDLEKKGLGTVRGTETAIGPVLRYQQRVDAVFDDVLDSLPAEERRALEYAALLPEDSVYAPWLVELLDQEGGEAAALPGYAGRVGEGAVEALEDKQLLRPRGEDALVLGLHRVLRRRAGERLEEEDRHAAIHQLVALAERRGEASREALTDLERRRELTPLGFLVREFIALDRLDAAVSLTNWIAPSLRDLGRFSEALELLEHCDTHSEAGRVPEAAIAILYNHLALTLKDLGDLRKARERMERAVQIAERSFPQDQTALATRYSNLAMILKALGELREARERMEQAIQIDEHNFPPDHSALATSCSNLALILKDIGDPGTAKEWMERAIRIEEHNLPEDHPTLATTYSNLALILKDLGEPRKAKEWMERAIRIEERNLPEYHPRLAKSYSNLATILKDLGELKEARERMERAIQIDERNFQKDHPILATRYSNLAAILMDLGELKEARERIVRAIQIAEHNFLEDHPSLATRYNNLAHIEWELGDTGAACALFQRSLAILLKHFSHDHPHVRAVSASTRKACGQATAPPSAAG